MPKRVLPSVRRPLLSSCRVAESGELEKYGPTLAAGIRVSTIGLTGFQTDCGTMKLGKTHWEELVHAEAGVPPRLPAFGGIIKYGSPAVTLCPSLLESRLAKYGPLTTAPPAAVIGE